MSFWRTAVQTFTGRLTSPKLMDPDQIARAMRVAYPFHGDATPGSTLPMTFEIGYALSSEEHRPDDLVRYAVTAEELGFSFAGVSDHFHPWTDSQGQSPFVWSVLGAVAQATRRLRIGT